MSEENVEVMREWIDAFNRGGPEESMRFLDERLDHDGGAVLDFLGERLRVQVDDRRLHGRPYVGGSLGVYRIRVP